MSLARRFSLDDLSTQTSWADLDSKWLQQQVNTAREEDLGGGGFTPAWHCPGDATTELISSSKVSDVRLVARTQSVICGLPLLSLICSIYSPDEDESVTVELLVNDGDHVRAGTSIATLHGRAKTILQAERPILNFLQHLSGVARETAQYTALLKGSGVRLLDTRKTTPGWRALEKYAVAQGGGWNHRRGLYDRIMLKDNHLAALGATGGDRLTAAVQQARTARPDLPIEVEIDTLAQLEAVITAGADVVMLDNFNNAAISQAVAQAAGRVYLEASGGITHERLPALAQTGVDFISTGATVHQSRWIDIGLDWGS